jgi:hypothetical protein
MIVLVAVIASGSAACQTTTAARVASEPSVTTQTGGNARLAESDPLVSGLITNAQAAQRQGDWQMLRRFQASLVARAGGPAITAARADYQRALADLAAAEAVGDSRARAEFRVRIRALCAPTSLVSAFEHCDADVVSWGS